MTLFEYQEIEFCLVVFYEHALICVWKEKRTHDLKGMFEGTKDGNKIIRNRKSKYRQLIRITKRKMTRQRMFY